MYTHVRLTVVEHQIVPFPCIHTHGDTHKHSTYTHIRTTLSQGKLNVEEQEIELLPGSSKALRVRVCGVQEGFLEITGVVYRLGGQVGVKCFQPVTLTRRKKAKRGEQYEVDTSLRARVVRAMPRLVATLHGLEAGWWRQGQLVKTVMELRNEGTCAAHRLRLAMSHQHSIALRPAAELDADPLSGGARAEGLMVPPEYDANFPVINMDIGVIEPGGVVLLPLWVRPPTIAPLNIRLLVQYTPPPGESHAMKYRLVKLSADLDVRPSLTTGLHVRWAGRGAEERLIVAVDMQAAGDKLELIDVACVSSRWAVSLLSSQSLPSTPPKLPPHAQAVWLLQLRGHKDQEGDNKDKESVTFALPGSSLGHALGTALGALIHGVERADASKSHGTAASTRMIVVWKDAQSGAVGFHYLPCPMPAVPNGAAPQLTGPPQSPSKALLPPEHKHRDGASPDGWPVRVRIEAPRHVIAPAGMVTTVGVTLVLHGVLDTDIRVLVEAFGPSDVSGRGWDYEWGGAVRTTVTVPARHDASVSLKVVVRQPCTVNLNRLTISFPDMPNLSPLHLPATRFQHLLQVDAPEA
jgi:hypothetical protein